MKIIKAKDCSIPEYYKINDSDIHEILNAVNKSALQSESFFLISKKELTDEPIFQPIYNPKEKQYCWFAGRFIGKTRIPLKNSFVDVEITPRFGEIVLEFMIQDILGVIISKSKIENFPKTDFLIKKYISLIWLNHLKKASRFGFPKAKNEIIHRGFFIKGMLDVSKTIKSAYNKKQVVSRYTERQKDILILEILFQSSRILFDSKILQVNKTVQHSIDLLNNQQFKKRAIPIKDYQGIKYQRLFSSFKSLVDLSWQIIHNKGMFYNEGKKDGFSYFLDMAEIWESFLFSILKEHFNDDWNVSQPDNIQLYKNKFLEKGIRPDIIMEHKIEKKIIVIDAKWKNMSFNKKDVDREDFFQIHTYAKYYGDDLLAAGLVYPTEKNNEVENYPAYLIGSNPNQKFFIEYINLGDLNNNGDKAKTKVEFENRILKFCKRIEKSIIKKLIVKTVGIQSII